MVSNVDCQLLAFGPSAFLDLPYITNHCEKQNTEQSAQAEPLCFYSIFSAWKVLHIIIINPPI